jgi:hypothetical protein
MPGGSFTLRGQPTHSIVIAIGQGVENFACRVHKYQMVTGVALSASHVPVSYECYLKWGYLTDNLRLNWYGGTPK